MDDYKDYITIGDMATKLGVSKPRIHQLIDSINAKNETVKQGRVSLISPDLADRIEKRQLAGKEHIVVANDTVIEDLNKRVESLTEDNSKLTNELTTANTSIQVISHDNDILKAKNDELNKRIIDLQNQLDAKDEQLKVKDMQIITANELADHAQKLQLNQQQQIEHKKGNWFTKWLSN